MIRNANDLMVSLMQTLREPKNNLAELFEWRTKGMKMNQKLDT